VGLAGPDRLAQIRDRGDFVELVGKYLIFLGVEPGSTGLGPPVRATAFRQAILGVNALAVALKPRPCCNGGSRNRGAPKWPRDRSGW
jgi:hypothetical protein